MPIKTSIAFVSLLLLLSQSFSVIAVSIFQWVDAEGVTHFSDETPVDAEATTKLNQYEIEENYRQRLDPEEDYFSIVNQWKRTNDEREARLKLQRENKPVRQSQAQESQHTYDSPSSQPYYTGGQIYPYYNNRGRVLHRGRYYNHAINQPRPQEPATVTPGYMGNVGRAN